MTITLELGPEVEAIARARAQAQGIPLEDYLRTFLASALTQRDSSAGAVISDADWERLLRASTFRSERPLSDEALSREALYED